MRQVRILRAAVQEAVEAAAWYELQRPGLGREFAGAVQAALDLLESEVWPLLPMSGAAGQRNVMRLMLRRFPYDVVVVERRDDILVLAIAHHSRRPGYWRDRQSISQIQDAGRSEQYPEAARIQEVKVTPVRYAIVIENPGSNFSAYVPDLPGCIATGETIAETERLIREAIEFHLEGLRADGTPIPPPSSRVDYVEVAA